MFRRLPAAAETRDGFVTATGAGSGARDRGGGSDRVDRDRCRDGGPGTVGPETGAAMSKSVAALGLASWLRRQRR